MDNFNLTAFCWKLKQVDLWSARQVLYPERSSLQVAVEFLFSKIVLFVRFVSKYAKLHTFQMSLVSETTLAAFVLGIVG